MTKALELVESLGGAKVAEVEGGAVLASFADPMDALLFLAAKMPGTEQGLNAEYKRWVMQEGLEFIDAEELFHEVAAEEATSKAQEMDQSRRMNWLQDFMARWEGARNMGAADFWNAPVEAPDKEEMERRQKVAEMAARFDARDCADRVDAGA